MRPATLKIIDRIATEPVTLTEAKTQVGLLAAQTDFDSLLAGAIAAGRRVIEQRLGVSIMATQYRAKWPAGAVLLYLPAPPLLLDESHPITVTVGGETLTASDYELEEDASPAELELDTRAADQVVVEYWGGVTSADDVEPTIKAALLMFVEHQFNHRGVLTESGFQELPQGFEMLLAASSYSGGY
jgi:uncharacterized phiE125 gp8 family phage protein